MWLIPVGFEIASIIIVAIMALHDLFDYAFRRHFCDEKPMIAFAMALFLGWLVCPYFVWLLYVAGKRKGAEDK